MTLVASWLRLELRRRWRSLLVLTLLVALSAGTVLTAVAGARRGDSAADRLVERTLLADAVALPNQPGFDWDPVRELPQVESLSRFVVGGWFEFEGVPEESTQFAYDNQIMQTVERPVVLDGRLADPNRVDEAVITAEFPDHYGKEVGDTITLRLATPEQVDLFETEGAAGAPEGPEFEVRIVGVVRSGWFGDPVGSPGGIIASPALFTRYYENLVGAQESGFVNALVRLNGGEAALPAFREGLAEVTGRTDIDVWNNHDLVRHAKDVNSFEADCLLAFGMAALAAALFLVGQSVARYTTATVSDLDSLRASGLTSRQATLTAIAAPTIAAVFGAGVGVVGAIVASRWMPFGAAGTVEPDPGIDVDVAVLGIGGALTPLLVVAGAAVAARFARSGHRSAARRSAIASAAARMGLPVPVVVGTRFALEPGRGRSAVPVRPALLGAVVGVLGVIGAFTFSAGVDDAVDNPERFGLTYQAEAFGGFNGEDFGPLDEMLTAVAADPRVSGVNNSRLAVAEAEPGDVPVTTYTHDPVGKPLPVVITDGRMARGPDEITLGPASADRLGADVGSTVELRGTEGAHEFRVSGVGFLPTASHNTYKEGGWVDPDAYSRLFGDGFKFHTAQVSFEDGTDVEAAIAEFNNMPGGAFSPPVPPTEIEEIRDVRVLPVVLGGFLLLLAVGAVGHALATAVRRRFHDVAVLRALGMTRWQSRAMVVTQATVLALVGLSVGVPLGFALGRGLWRHVAEDTPLDYHPPTAFWALLLVAPLALLIANLLAAWPGHRAARLRIGQVLRAE